MRLRLRQRTIKKSKLGRLEKCRQEENDNDDDENYKVRNQQSLSVSMQQFVLQCKLHKMM